MVSTACLDTQEQLSPGKTCFKHCIAQRQRSRFSPSSLRFNCQHSQKFILMLLRFINSAGQRKVDRVLKMSIKPIQFQPSGATKILVLVNSSNENGWLDVEIIQCRQQKTKMAPTLEKNSYKLFIIDIETSIVKKSSIMIRRSFKISFRITEI